jgi:hypothetical protein
MSPIDKFSTSIDTCNMDAPTKTLPVTYRHAQSIDLSQSPSLVIWLNVIALLLFFLFGYAYLMLIAWMRPGVSFAFENSSLIANLLVLLIVYIGVIVLHEIIHGLFFWIITGEKPRFGFRGAYAYAAAPDWYLPRGPYLVVGLSPLVLITLLGILLIPITPNGWLILLGVAVTANASGAVGDLAVVLWLLLKHPANLLLRDRGDAVDIYHPTTS